MSSVVFDSSVILAIARSERYDTNFLSRVDSPVMSAVNFAEVISRLLDLNIDVSRPEVHEAYAILDSIEPFTRKQALLAGELRRLGKNISLGDRACIALAIDLGADIYTADTEWGNFNVGVPIHLIR